VPQIDVQCNWSESAAEFKKRWRAEATAAPLPDDHEEEKGNG
jgi:hypothetical protein